jgi:hypothetical protein
MEKSAHDPLSNAPEYAHHWYRCITCRLRRIAAADRRSGLDAAGIASFVRSAGGRGRNITDHAEQSE